jgi:hypothetical protein
VQVMPHRGVCGTCALSPALPLLAATCCCNCHVWLSKQHLVVSTWLPAPDCQLLGAAAVLSSSLYRSCSPCNLLPVHTTAGLLWSCMTVDSSLVCVDPQRA